MANRGGRHSKLATDVLDRPAAHFVAIATGPVARYEMPNVSALNFVIEGALSGGVTRALTLDAHGKSLSSLMLDLEI